MHGQRNIKTSRIFCFCCHPTQKRQNCILVLV